MRPIAKLYSPIQVRGKRGVFFMVKNSEIPIDRHYRFLLIRRSRVRIPNGPPAISRGFYTHVKLYLYNLPHGLPHGRHLFTVVLLAILAACVLYLPGARAHTPNVEKCRTVWHDNRLPKKYEARKRAYLKCRRRRNSHNRGHSIRTHHALASAYGPGLYGNRTACGQTLTPASVGVAHKTLPCGARLYFYANGRRVTARVIDRGPYHGGRVFDLTAGLVRKLGHSSVWAFGERNVKWAAV